MKKPSRHSNLLLRIMAGIYLIYTAVSLLKSVLSGDAPGGYTWLGYICFILFLAVGAMLLIVSVKKYYCLLNDNGNESTDSCENLQRSTANTMSANDDASSLPFREFPALPHICESILSYVRDKRSIAKTFNRKNYATGFASYMKECQDVFITLDDIILKQPFAKDSILQAVAFFLVAGLDSDYTASRNGRERELKMNTDKGTLTFYFVPMIQELNTSYSQDLATIICQTWNASFPKYSFNVGTYQRILNGFTDKSFLRTLGIQF